MKINNYKRFFLFIIFVLYFPGCRQSFNLVTSLDGPDGIPLSITPSKTEVIITKSITFTAEGGVKPYFFSVISGNGTFTSSAGIYTAPLLTGTEIIRVTDSYNVTADAEITVVPASILSISPSSITLNLSDSIIFSASGGIAPYTFTLTGVGGTGENLSGSTYTAPSDTAGNAAVRVTDSTGATADAVITVEPASPLSINPSSITINYSDTVVLSASGGIPGYTFTLTGALGGTGENLSSSTSYAIYTAPSDATGNATIQVTDNYGATSTAAITVTP